MDPRTVFIPGAGGMGNIGAEAILLAVIHFYQEHWGPETRFILAAWHPDRVRFLVDRLPGRFDVVKQTVPLDKPGLLRQSDAFVVGGDVVLTETVIPLLPSYWTFRALWARLLGNRVTFMGIEVETLRLAVNRGAVRLVLDRVTQHYLVRNEEARDHLLRLSARPAQILMGCEPVLMIEDRHLEAFPAPALDRDGAELRVAFGIRDFFSKPLRLDPFHMKLKRRDARPGQLSAGMEQTVKCLARMADRLAEKHNARLFVIPHHALAASEKVILSDREVADHMRAAMRNPGRLSVLPENLHPYSAMNAYRQMDLVVSMRHHANSFAFRYAVPTIGLAVSEKIKGHFRQVGQTDLLLDPLDPDFAAADRIVDQAVSRREEISAGLRQRLKSMQAEMKQALDVALRYE